MSRKPLLLLVLLAALAGGGWYLARARISAGALAGTALDVVKPHRNQPPHGGTPVVLGDGDFCMELVREPSSGTLRVYVLDGEMEDFVRIKEPQLELEIEQHGRRRTLGLRAVADPATGETVGDTCLFETRTSWLKGANPFKGVVKRIAIHDRTFQSIPFRCPGGG